MPTNDFYVNAVRKWRSEDVSHQEKNLIFSDVFRKLFYEVGNKWAFSYMNGKMSYDYGDKFGNRMHEWVSYYQESLFKAFKSYDESRQVAFETYVSKIYINSLNSHYRKNQKNMYNVPIDGSDDDPDESAPIIPVGADNEETYHLAVDLNEYLHLLASVLTITIRTIENEIKSSELLIPMRSEIKKTVPYYFPCFFTSDIGSIVSAAWNLINEDIRKDYFQHYEQLIDKELIDYITKNSAEINEDIYLFKAIKSELKKLSEFNIKSKNVKDEQCGFPIFPQVIFEYTKSESCRFSAESVGLTQYYTRRKKYAEHLAKIRGVYKFESAYLEKFISSYCEEER